MLEIFPENEQEKVTCPPSPQGEGARGEAQIAVYPSVLRTLEYHLETKVEGLVVRDACEETEVEKVSAYAVT